MRRIVAGILVVAALVGLGVARGGAPAGALSDDEERFVQLVNETRAAAGLPALEVHRELADLSRGWAEAMRSAGGISHANPISAGLTAPWLKLGENVGTGPDIDAVMNAFVASPGHYANIVDPAFTHIGVGVVWDGERLYTTHRFMRLQPSQPTPTTTPPTATTSPPTTTPTLPAAGADAPTDTGAGAGRGAAAGTGDPASLPAEPARVAAVVAALQSLARREAP